MNPVRNLHRIPNGVNNPDRPKIGLALSGGSGRAIAHIGVLEVLEECEIPIDYITACSSGTLIAASFACGTMENLKQDWMKLNKAFFLGMVEIDKSGKGLLRLEKFAQWFHQYTGDKKFEDVQPRLGFVCADIRTAEPVLMTLGNLLKAGQASCAVPGVFEPVEWGNKLLVDGGLFSIIPTTQAKEMGADLVIGVDIATTKHIFLKEFIQVRKGYNFLRKSLPVRLYIEIHDFLDRIFSKSLDFIYYNQSDILEESEFANPGLFSIFGKALDISRVQRGKQRGIIKDCDYMISPNVKHLGKIDFESAAEMLREGRRVTLAAAPEIKKLIRDFNWRKNHGA